MPDYYPILEVGPEWALDQEPMGGKAKFWFRIPEEGETTFLFKYPRPNTGEHWAEMIASKIADVLQIPCARVGLATFRGERGSTSESFISDGQQLWHGNQILVRHLQNYDLDQRFGQSRHTLKNIWLALERVFEDPEGTVAAKVRFAEFLVLDAVIGNTDRHHENWGVVRRRTTEGWVGYLAPSFDHASSLGREFMDKRREGLLANNRISNYSEKGKGGIYWSESDESSLSPLELVRKAYQEYPSLFSPALAKLGKIDEKTLSEIIERIPPDWMTDAARRFAMQLIIYHCNQLKELM